MNTPHSQTAKQKVLIVDDLPANLQLLRDALEPEGYRILGASNGESALRIAAGALPDIVLLDVVMPGMDGYAVCRKLKADEQTRHIPVIFVTARDEDQSLVEGFRAGGVDYITKPFASEEILMRVRNHLAISQLTQELRESNEALRTEIARREQVEHSHRKTQDALQRADERLMLISEKEATQWGIDGFVGRSQTIETILQEVQQLQGIGTTSVLITGESGTGKELIARAIHFGGVRAKGPFVPVNCSAIPHDLADSSFFGHTRGAFTGATANHRGYFELADGGTLFLDEIGDMPLELQPKLLRTLETGSILSVGGNAEKQVDVRVVAATNRDIGTKAMEGHFREDLYFRLARFVVHVPPLRERREDISLLVEHFLKLFGDEMGIHQPKLSPAALTLLESYHFPGNVRELKNIIECALIKSHGSTIQPTHLNFVAMDALSATHSTGVTTPSILHPPQSDEEKILEYLRHHPTITNTECRNLLGVNLHRASYLLRKMHRSGVLGRHGGHRGARYYRNS